MPRRPPRFALVLSALVAGAGLVALLAGTGAGSSPPSPPPSVGLGPSRTCVHVPAQAKVTVRSAIVVSMTSRVPVRVTERATGPRGTATVTQGTTVSAHERFTQAVAVTHVSAARASACARAGSSTAARDLALRKASSLARAAARQTAARDAESALRALRRRLYPSVVSRARAQGSLHAHQIAEKALPLLAAKAIAQARRQAGG